MLIRPEAPPQAFPAAISNIYFMSDITSPHGPASRNGTSIDLESARLTVGFSPPINDPDLSSESNQNHSSKHQISSAYSSGPPPKHGFPLMAAKSIVDPPVMVRCRWDGCGVVFAAPKTGLKKACQAHLNMSHKKECSRKKTQRLCKWEGCQCHDSNVCDRTELHEAHVYALRTHLINVHFKPQWGEDYVL
jgi:hypothetical protein